MAGNLKNILLLIYTGLFLLHKESIGLTVSKIRENLDTATPMILMDLDRPTPLRAEVEDASTLLIEMPQDTRWLAPKTGRFQAGFQSYSYTEYREGGGDLLIKIDPRYKLKQFGTAPNGIFGISLSPPVAPSTKQGTTPLIISNFKVGLKNNSTRIVMDLNRVSTFKVTENMDGQKIYILPVEPTQWIPPVSLSQSSGAFKGYQLIRIEKDVGIEIKVEPGTRILKGFILDPTSKEPKFVLDIGREPLVPAVSTDRVPTSSTSKAQSASDKSSFKPIQKMTITYQGDETIVRFLLRNPISFKVLNNTETKQVILETPKLSWSGVETPNLQGGLIRNFEVDQSSAAKTKIIFNVRPETQIIEKKFIPQEKGGRYILILSQGENKTPTWLIDEADAYLSYSKTNKYIAAESMVPHRGGISPFMNIGEGFYIGAGVSQITSENNTTANLAGETLTTKNSTLGMGGKVFAGWGYSLDRLYLGGEIGGALNYASNTTKLSTVGEKNLTEKLNYKSLWDISLRPGYYISPSSLLYGKIGVSSANFKFTSYNNDTLLAKIKASSLAGFIYGVGLESAWNDLYTVRIEGTQTTYQPMRFNEGVYARKDRPVVTQVLAALGYKIAPMSGPAAKNLYAQSISTGFYIGGNGGFKNVTDKKKTKGYYDGDPSFYENQVSSLEPVWSVFAGYSTVYEGRVTYGAEVDFELNPIVLKEQLQQSTRTESYTNKISWLTSLTGRLGYIFNYGTVIYGRLGIIMGRIAQSASSTNTDEAVISPNTNNKSSLYGIRLGGGLEAFLNPHFSIRGDYTLDMFPEIQFNNDRIPNTYIQDKNTFINSEFKIGISYLLNP